MNYDMCRKMKLFGCSREKLQKHQNIHWKCELGPDSTAAAWALDKTLFTGCCLRLSLGEAAMTCVAFPLWNISSVFLYVLFSVLKSVILKTLDDDYTSETLVLKDPA